ncbi:VanW family protein [Brevibacillus composti]|uniref:VanW family protein n=1 Tax=Brevibacillus composti TaxID=2796470 RepID=UPI001E62415A|nr:VanW family protein [Brevibacillus composti]
MNNRSRYWIIPVISAFALSVWHAPFAHAAGLAEPAAPQHPAPGGVQTSPGAPTQPETGPAPANLPANPAVTQPAEGEAPALVPAYDRHELIQKLGVDEEQVLGIYYTSMEGSTDNRKHNIVKAMRKINGEKIKPGEIFSYNEEVGNSNLAEDNWKEAHVIVNGQLTAGYGGGICQVSSTLFNAVQEAKLPIVERHTHSKTVGYVPVGQDATVAYGLLDFRFSNPFDHTLTIKAKVFDDTNVVIAILKK